MAIWQIEFFPHKNERRSAHKIIMGFPNHIRVTAVHRLEDMQSHQFADWQSQWFNQIEGKVFELYVDQYRIAYCLDGRTIVILHAFKKGKQKTHIRDRNTALRHYREYKARKEDR